MKTTMISKQDIMNEAAKANGRRRTRVFTERDAEKALEALEQVRDDEKATEIFVYADGGDFVPNSYKYRADMTRVRIARDENGEWTRYGAGVVDAKRSKGQGPWVSVNRNGQYRALD